MFNTTGCYIDGTFGQEATRTTLANMIDGLFGCPDESDGAFVKAIQTALAGSMSDDDWESDAATDVLNANTPTAFTFIWEAGDLLLIDTTEEELADIAAFNGR